MTLRRFRLFGLTLVKGLLFLIATLVSADPALGGGPRYVAGASYFNPAVKGQPILWAQGQVAYFVDNGPLSSLVNNQQATAMVDAAAAIWSAVPTAAVSLTDQGNLAEDVTGANVLASNGTFQQPADVTSVATTTPVAVIFDADGSVTDALYGTGASQPDNCTQNSVFVWIDNFTPNATLAHGVIVLNGRCATSAGLLAMMSYQLERAFGRILGLDFSQVNDGAQAVSSKEINGVLGWPVMQPENGTCGPSGGTCLTNPAVLRLDDIAALNRLYPVTSANQSSFPGKLITAANTISIQGTISFRNGVGMQGVNVVVRPLDNSGNPLYADTVTFVSGSYFNGNHGNPVTGWVDGNGNRLDRFGSDDPAEQGYFDLSGIPLPPGVTLANYQVTFEAINPLYVNTTSVGPYLLGSPRPSGTMPALQVNGMMAGGAQMLTVTVATSANGPVSNQNASQVASRDVYTDGGTGIPAGNLTQQNDDSGQVGSEEMTALARRVRSGIVRSLPPGGIRNATGSEVFPSPLPATGMWTSRLAQVGQSDWFILPVRGNRIFTVVTQSLDETGAPSAAKAMPALGVWDGFDRVGSTPAGWTPAANGFAAGETWLQVATSGNDVVRLAIADQRGDGRPDYVYRGWVLYADSVTPARLPASGGSILIRGTGFRAGDTVQVGGVSAMVTSIQPTKIWATVSAASESGSTTGSLDVEVDDLPGFSAMAVIPGGLSYDAASSDLLGIVTAPANLVPLNVPEPFTVFAQGADGAPAGGVTVLYSVTGGVAMLGCGQSACAVTTGGDGRATLPVTAISGSIAVVTASLTTGVSVQAHFSGGTPAALTGLTPTLFLAAGATANWPVQALAQSAGTPVAGQSVAWQSAASIAAPAAVATSSAGIAAATLIVGPLAEGQTAISNACLNGGSQCAAFTVFGARPEFASLRAVSGTAQSIPVAGTPTLVVLRVLDMNGNAMAGGTVTIHQMLYAWAPPCARHGRCAQPPLLASQTVTLTSALDGTVTVTPLTLAGQATNLTGLATTGNAGSLPFTVEQHP